VYSLGNAQKLRVPIKITKNGLFTRNEMMINQRRNGYEETETLDAISNFVKPWCLALTQLLIKPVIDFLRNNGFQII